MSGGRGVIARVRGLAYARGTGLDLLPSVDAAARHQFSTTAAFDANRAPEPQHIQPLIQELILHESDEAVAADRVGRPTDRFRPSASDGSTSRSAKTYLTTGSPSSTSSSTSCVSTEQQRAALL
jgi:hypothetical protein